MITNEQSILLKKAITEEVKGLLPHILFDEDCCKYYASKPVITNTGYLSHHQQVSPYYVRRGNLEKWVKKHYPEYHDNEESLSRNKELYNKIHSREFLQGVLNDNQKVN